MATDTQTDHRRRDTLSRPDQAAKRSRDHVAQVIKTVQERWERRDFSPSPPARQKVTKHRS